MSIENKFVFLSTSQKRCFPTTVKNNQADFLSEDAMVKDKTLLSEM
jgi:hypothetical protein